jgi:hypothetical protein
LVRGRIIGESFSTTKEGGVQQNYVPQFGGIPALPSYYGDVPMQAWGSGAAMPSTKFCGTQHSLCGSICTPSSTTTKYGHHWMIRYEKHAIYCSHPNQCKPIGGGNANITYELGCLHLTPPGQFIGGVVQYIMSKGTTTKTININHRQKIRERRSFSYLSFSLLL